MIQTQHQPTSTLSTRLDWPLLLFFTLAFGIAWGIMPILSMIAQRAGLPDWITLSQMGETWDFGDTVLGVPHWVIYLLTRIQDFSFSIAGLIMISALHGTTGLREIWRKLTDWRVGWRWYLAAFLPFGLYALATVMAGATGSFTFTAASLFRILFSAEAGFLVYLFLRGAMGEELGLRGFALPRLQETLSPFKASVIIGALWAAWHLPVLFQRDLPSIIVFLLAAFLLSFVFTWLYNGSGQSLIPVLLFHAAQNSEEIFETLFPTLFGTDWELISSLGLLLSGAIIAIYLWRKVTSIQKEINHV